MSVLNASIYLDKLLWFVKSEIVDINGNLSINYFSGRRPLEFGQIYASWNIGLTWFNHCHWKIHRLLLKKWGKTLELDGASVSGLSLFLSKKGSKSWTPSPWIAKCQKVKAAWLLGGANILYLLRYSALEFSNFQAFERKAGENESLEEVITCGKHHFWGSNEVPGEFSRLYISSKGYRKISTEFHPVVQMVMTWAFFEPRHMVTTCRVLSRVPRSNWRWSDHGF